MRTILGLIAVLACLGLALAFSRSAQLFVVNVEAWWFDGTVIRGQVFDPETGLALDIYAPKTARDAPVAVFFHGGSWKTGDKGQYPFLGITLAQSGIIAIVPDYRKYPDVRFPAFIEDGAKAVGWAHANIARFGGNPDRIVLSGHSAGAHTAMMLGVDPRALREAGVPPGAIAGVAGLAGPYHFTPEEPDMQAIFGPPERYPAMQASTFVTGTEPPILMLYGLRDDVVGQVNIDRLGAAFDAKGTCYRTVLYNDEDHISIISAFTWPLRRDNPVVDDLIGFIQTPNAAARCP